MKSLPVVVLLDNVRSAYNVGAIFRTADAVGVEMVICCGYTPYPGLADDKRPKFEVAKVNSAIEKTALGSHNLPCQHFDSALQAVKTYSAKGYQIVALEQAKTSVNLFDFKPNFPLVLTLGHEVAGTDSSLLQLADKVIEIPMHGAKESLNVSVAAGVALYQLRQKLV